MSKNGRHEQGKFSIYSPISLCLTNQGRFCRLGIAVSFRKEFVGGCKIPFCLPVFSVILENLLQRDNISCFKVSGTNFVLVRTCFTLILAGTVYSDVSSVLCLIDSRIAAMTSDTARNVWLQDIAGL